MTSTSDRRRLLGAAVLGLLLTLPPDGAAAAPVDATGRAAPQGTLGGWGANAFGQLGDGTEQSRWTPVTVAGLPPVAAAAAGVFHSLAVLDDGSVRAWGLNDDGQLGDGTTGQHTTPGVVSDLDDAVAVAAGERHSLALRADGTVAAWGANDLGQLGLGSTGPDVRVPVRVPGLRRVRAIAAGDAYSLALLKDGTVVAWGDDSAGQLGDGQVGGTAAAPAPVAGLRGVEQVAAGFATSVVRLSDGTVMTWGSNTEGQLGTGSAAQAEPRPAAVPGLARVRSVAAGAGHVLALLRDGTVRSWGLNDAGQLGDGRTGTGRDTPGVVVGVTGARAVAAGATTSYALVDDDAGFLSWGDNSLGALGDGSAADHRDTAGRAVSGLGRVEAVVGGFSFALALGGGRD
ncbi:cell wall anchor protein [Catellatospora sp. KI3]|uniref:RCC1 domain-containing protein n=1 Tax=Catellatospora sp. KI3 TaxID=3041620 RepID=UPI00248229FB|nr:cell wall anchor protein [Catellatospora sp. KI3]MDI1463634.1 cell wall anchor protein [Catellatospora sp. KI3]